MDSDNARNETKGKLDFTSINQYYVINGIFPFHTFTESETAFVINPSGTSTNEFCATTDKKSLLSKKSKSSDNSDGAGKS